MLRRFFLFSLLGLLSSCDCGVGETGPVPYFEHLLTHPGAGAPDQVLLARFQSSLKNLSVDELGNMLGSINYEAEDFDLIQTQPWFHPASLLADEFWLRNPRPEEIEEFVGSYSVRTGNQQFPLMRLAQTSPHEGWKLIKEFYEVYFHYRGYSPVVGLWFFAGLQKHHPKFAKRFIIEMIEDREFDDWYLKSHALAGILHASRRPAEIIDFIGWIQTRGIENTPIGFINWYFPKWDPSKPERNLLLPNCIAFLAKLSPETAREWIKNNKGHLNPGLAYCYLFGAVQRSDEEYETGYKFLARHTDPNDGILEELFEGYFQPEEEFKNRLLKLRAEANP